MLDFVNEFYNLFYAFIVGITGDVSSNAVYSDFATLGSYLITAIVMFAVFAVPFVLLIKLIQYITGVCSQC